jgi:predicted small metal-binding protein
MIKEKNGKWLVTCVLCSWRAETNTEQEAQQELSRHLDVVHKQPSFTITERESPVTDDIKQGNLREAQKPQGITKKGT